MLQQFYWVKLFGIYRVSLFTGKEVFSKKIENGMPVAFLVWLKQRIYLFQQSWCHDESSKFPAVLPWLQSKLNTVNCMWVQCTVSLSCSERSFPQSLVLLSQNITQRLISFGLTLTLTWPVTNKSEKRMCSGYCRYWHFPYG